MSTYIIVGIVLQVVMVVSGHYSEAVINLSAVLGVGIPLIVGAVFGATRALSTKDAALGGFAIGIVGAFIGILLAIMMGDQEWILLSFGPISSAVTGVIGSLGLFFSLGKRRATAQVQSSP